ncbi:MAG: glycine cleavage system protein R [Polyangiaceae bacterium]
MTDRKLKVMTAVGSDRPGLVKAISALIHGAGANLEDSRMAILGGEFALVLLYSGPTEALDRVQAGTEPLSSKLQLQFIIKDTASPAARPYRSYRLRVSGLDHPGIVERVTDVLALREVNVESLDTRLAHLPMTGTPTFVLDAILQIPPEVAIGELRKAMNDLCDAAQLDFQLEARV